LLAVGAALIVLAALAWAVEGAIVTPAAADDPSDEGLEEFVPTEKVPADDAVAFPVDI
jgi:hypothetical protein